MKRFFKSLCYANRISITFYSSLLVIALFLVQVPILDLIELKTYDFRFLARGRVQPSSAVVMAVIDEKSLDVEGRWPWARSKIAALVDALSGDGAKVIGFDIGFLEPDENSRLQLLRELEQDIKAIGLRDRKLTKLLRSKEIDADNDLALAEAIRRSKATVVLGYFFHTGRVARDYVIEQTQINKQLQRISDSRYPAVHYEDKEAESIPFIEGYAPESSIDILARATDFSGFFNIFPDPDGVVRWMPLIVQCGGNLFPPLSIQCVWHYLDRPQLMVNVARYGVEGVQMGDRFIPTDEIGRMLINFLGPPKTFPHYSISDILHGKIPEGTFKEKVVLVGATAAGIYDLRSTPFSPVYPGMEVHATVIDNILRQDTLSRPKWTKIFDLLAIVVLVLLTGAVVPRLSAVKGILFAVVLFVLYLLIARWLFVSFGIWVNIVYPLLGLSVVYISLTVFHYFTEERERKKIRGAFSYYVSDSVVNEVLKDPERLKLGGDKRDLTVLFSDIRGFTTISEGLSPEDLVQLLNEYLTAMSNVVFKYEGTLDKFMGDAIMAIYGAPLEREDHPAMACHSALEMMEELRRLNRKWESEGRTPLDIGIGINTGMMMVGNMGSSQRFDYTVMGDAVNLGSRLEGANKNYRTNILISEFTYERVREEFVCMEVDSVRVKGKLLPVRIYQLLGHDDVPEMRRQAISYFHEGLQLYRSQKWNDAIKTFERVKAMDGDLRAAELYIQRCLDLKLNPPPPDWDGVFTMVTK